MFQTFKSVLKNGWTNFRRNSYVSLAATGVMSLSLILFLGLLSLQYLTTESISSLEMKVDVSAYFKTDAPEDQILQVKTDLQALSEVASVIYTSRDEALANFRARHSQDAMIEESLSLLDDNPLGASLNIKTKEFSQYASIADFLKNDKYKTVVQQVNFEENKGVIQSIANLSGSIRNWGLTATLILALIAVLVTFNTVRLTIFNQKQEIEIMRLVGASNWHIRGPYLAEGGFYGLFAALISLGIFYPVVFLVSGKISSFVESVDLGAYFTHGAWQVVLMTAVLGIFLGVISSFIAIRRHLKI
jgi:cell division transport system permease protein